MIQTENQIKALRKIMSEMSLSESTTWDCSQCQDSADANYMPLRWSFAGTLPTAHPRKQSFRI